MLKVECPTCGEHALVALDDDEEFTLRIETVSAGSRLVVTARGMALPVHECGGPTREQQKADRVARALASLPPLPARAADDDVPEDAQWVVRVHHNGRERNIVMKPLSDGDDTCTP
jgi:hypothetical protein